MNWERKKYAAKLRRIFPAPGPIVPSLRAVKRRKNVVKMRLIAAQTYKLVFQISQNKNEWRIRNVAWALLGKWGSQVPVWGVYQSACVVLHYVKQKSESEYEESQHSGDTSSA